MQRHDCGLDRGVERSGRGGVGQGRRGMGGTRCGRFRTHRGALADQWKRRGGFGEQLIAATGAG